MHQKGHIAYSLYIRQQFPNWAMCIPAAWLYAPTRPLINSMGKTHCDRVELSLDRWWTGKQMKEQNKP